LRPDPAGWTAVLPGAWNTAIFTPAWIAHHLFQEEEEIAVELAVAFGVDERLMRFPTKRIELRVSESRLVLNPIDLQAESLQEVNHAVNSVLRVLQHTPIAAIGFNFRFHSNEPGDRLREALAVPDAEHLQEQGLAIRQSKSVKHLSGVEVGGDPLLNLTLTRDHATNDHGLEFNYHYPRERIQGHPEDVIVTLRDHAIRVLESYGETYEEDAE